MTKRAEKFAEWFSPDSHNFFGSGLTLQEFMLLGHAERFQRSWGQQDAAEQRRRLHFVVELVGQLKAICAVTNFATAIAEMAISAVIEGDWPVVTALSKDFVGEDFKGHPWEKVYADFASLLEAAALTVPKKGDESCPS